MISVDISNIWGEVSLPDLLSLEKEIFDAHMCLAEGTGAGSDFTGWLELPLWQDDDEISRIQNTAERIRADSDILVVIGTGSSNAGPQAAIELLQGKMRNMGRGNGDPQIYFAGDSFSTRQWNELHRLLEGRDFSIAIVSKSGTTTESAIAIRSLRWMLERKYGTDEARYRTYAITDPADGALRQLAEEEGWESFSIPANVSEDYSVLTAAGLLPMAVAGIDIAQVLQGAQDAKTAYDLRSFENPVWLYAAVRNLMYRRGKSMELLCAFEPAFHAFGFWWQQLFAGSEGKDGKGLFPVCTEFTRDLHSLGQMIQQGQRSFFETMLRFDPPELPHTILSDFRDLDGLNYLADKTLDFVEEQVYFSALDAHVDGGVSVITMECGPLDAAKAGELFYFFELSCAVSAYALGVNPFDRSGTEFYQQNMFRLTGKAGSEQ